jgi:hypothetical protein
LLWASACLDDGLLAVDDALGEEERSFGTYLQLERSSVTRSSADHLTGAGRAWLGSSFCARHVQARLSAASAEALPVFWTREQTGEEAATWLFFAHKHRYLHAIDRLLGGEPTRRVFCLPEDAVGKLPAHERILLFLAIAQMELNKVVVTIVPDPTYQELDGFVLVPDHQAVVANWIRGDGVWAVDTLDHRRTVRWYSDAVGDATIRSITTAASAAHRLQDVANYLELDWTNLTGRCGELSEPGIAGMIHTRSRRVTLSELDRVLRYVGSLTA